LYTQVGLVLSILAAGLFFAASVTFAFLWTKRRAEAEGLRARFGPIVDLSAECDRVQSLRDRLQAESDGLSAELGAARAGLACEIATSRSDNERALAEKRRKFEEKYSAALADLERLTAEVRMLDEQADLQSFGLYRPLYDFGTSERYKSELESVRSQQAAMLKAGTAAQCDANWTVDGDLKKGKQMSDQNMKLMLRAFNGESDAATSKVRFNNVVAIGERIEKAFDAINKSGKPNRCAVTSEYKRLKLAELHLAYEYAVKLNGEKEEQREIRERLRDEEKARREFEQAQRDAEREEQRYAAALEKARAELDATVGAKHERAEAKVAELEARLAEAHAQKERAISQAELTRSGNVYVISNEGSFGPGVFKVGMTRRLDPMDRVRELGDASVPFSFDVHAIIYSPDAPGLENALHRALASKRVNLVNLRKEFFAASLDEIEQAAHSSGQPGVEMVRTAVAEEFRTSVMLRQWAAAGGAAVVEVPVVAREQERFRELLGAFDEE
jgi:hypothetical protein